MSPKFSAIFLLFSLAAMPLASAAEKEKKRSPFGLLQKVTQGEIIAAPEEAADEGVSLIRSGERTFEERQELLREETRSLVSEALASLKSGGKGGVRTTAYTHTEPDHIQYGIYSAAGNKLKATKRYNSAAADWSRYPVGTRFRIAGDPTI